MVYPLSNTCSVTLSDFQGHSRSCLFECNLWKTVQQFARFQLTQSVARSLHSAIAEPVSHYADKNRPANNRSHRTLQRNRWLRCHFCRPSFLGPQYRPIVYRSCVRAKLELASNGSIQLLRWWQRSLQTAGAAGWRSAPPQPAACRPAVLPRWSPGSLARRRPVFT